MDRFSEGWYVKDEGGFVFFVCFLFLLLFFKKLLFIYLFIFGCVGSSFLCEGFL